MCNQPVSVMTPEFEIVLKQVKYGTQQVTHVWLVSDEILHIRLELLPQICLAALMAIIAFHFFMTGIHWPMCIEDDYATVITALATRRLLQQRQLTRP